MAQNGALSANQRRAIRCLLTCSTIGKAAEACGLGVRTVTRYLADPVFKAELRRQQDAALSSVTAALVGLAGESVEALRDILESESASASVKCRAALGWLAQMRQAVELADLAERVERLENTMEVKR